MNHSETLVTDPPGAPASSSAAPPASPPPAIGGERSAPPANGGNPPVGRLSQADQDNLLRAVIRHGGEQLAELVRVRLEERPNLLDAQSDAGRRVEEYERLYAELDQGRNLLGAYAWALARNRLEDGPRNPAKAHEAALDLIGKEGLYGQMVSRALNISTPSAGGIFLQGEQLDFFYRPLHAETAVMALNPVTVDIVDGSAELTGMETDPSMTWGKEVNTADITTEPTSGSRILTAKYGYALIPFSNKLLRSRLSSRVAGQAELGLRRCFAIGIDEALITSTGTESKPKGFYGWTGGSANQTGTDLPSVLTDYQTRLSAMAQANVRMERLGHIFNPRTRWHLALGIRTTSDDVPIFMKEIAAGTFLGYPYRQTTSVPVNLGGGGNESYSFIIDFAQAVVGTGQSLELQYFDSGSYVAGATTHHLIQEDTTVLRGVIVVDMVVPHTEAIQRIDQVTLGA